MKKLKIVLYMVSIILALFFSYLICNVHDYSIKSTIVITVFILLLSIYITYIYNKNVTTYDNVRKKEIIIIIVISLIVSIIILNFNTKFFLNDVKKTDISITTKDQVTRDNLINNIIVDNTIYKIVGTDIFNNGVLIKDSEIVIDKSIDNEIKISFPKAYDIKLVFNNIEDTIKIKDINEQTIELNENTNESMYIYKVISNSANSNIYILRAILSLIMLIYFLSLLFIVIICVKDQSKKYFITTTLVVAIIGIYYYLKTARGIFFNDTTGYIDYPFIEFFSMKFQGRTPVYPLIIKICQKLFDQQYLKALIVLQYIVWYIAVIYFYKLLELLIKNRKYIAFFTILYGVCPAIIGWNNVILTESIALSGTVIFIYYIVKYIKKPTVLSGTICITLAFILTFHRPTAIIYVIFLEIFWIGRFIFERSNIKIDLKCFIISTISIVLIIIYAIIFHKTFGIYSISDAMPRQDLFVCMSQQYYKSSGNDEFIQYINEGIEKNPNSMWNAMEYVKSKYTLSEINDLTSYCRKQNIGKYVKYIINLTMEHENIMFESYSLKFENNYIIEGIHSVLIFISFTHVYLVICIEAILLVKEWIKNKRVPWIHCGLFGFPFVIVFSSFVGTCGEFMRTAICALPFTYVSIATYIEILLNDKEVKNDKVIKKE